MVAVPVAMPVTTPLELTDAKLELVLQVPPVVASASVMVCPGQTVVGPVIAATAAVTVTGNVAGVQTAPIE